MPAAGERRVAGQGGGMRADKRSLLRAGGNAQFAARTNGRNGLFASHK